METFLIAYGLVWLLVSLYVLRLGVRQRRIRQQIAALEAQVAPLNTPSRRNAV